MRIRTSLIVGVIVLISVAVSGYVWYLTRTVPPQFPIGKEFTILEGESLRSVSDRLEKEGYIHSALFFRVWISLLGRDRQVHLGGYIFDSPHVLGYVVKKLVVGKPDVPLISLTVPEGSTSLEIATTVKKVLPLLTIGLFLEKVRVKNADGMLFPSTYFLLPSMSEEAIVDMMLDTFNERYREHFATLSLPAPLKDKNDIISLAAILEGEAKTETDMRIIAGILLKRLTIGMPLQVDVAPETYKIKGVPIVPINNPGVVSISAVFHPISTDYLFYLTAKDGTMHYAKTFTEHRMNIKKYLK